MNPPPDSTQKLRDWLERKKTAKKGFRGVRKVSSRRAGELAIYRKMLPGWKERHPVCEVCPAIKAAGFSVRCTGQTTHPHHVMGRIGKLLYDERYLLACCDGEGHPEFIHWTHPKEARSLGLLA